MPDDVYIAPGLAGSGGDISIGDPRGIAWIETTSIIGILGMLFSLIALFGLRLAWSVKGRKQGLGLNKTATAAYLMSGPLSATK